MTIESSTKRVNGAAAGGRTISWPMRIVLVLGIAVTSTLLLTTFSAWQYSRSKHRIFEQQLDSVRAQGLPVSAEELETYYYGTNAEAKVHGSALIRVFDSYDYSKEILNEIFFWERIPSPHKAYSNEDIEHARLHLDQNQLYMHELHVLLAGNEETRYSMNLADGYQVEFPHLAQVRNAVRMFALQSFVASVHGDHKMVTQSLTDALTMSDTLRNDPYAIAQLVRIACIGISSFQAQFALNESNLDVDSLTYLQEKVESLNLRGASIVGLIGERCMNYKSGEEIMGSIPIISWVGIRGYGFEEPPKFVWAEISAMHLYHSLTELIEIGAHDPWERRNLVDSFIKTATSGWSLLHDSEQTLLPALARAFSAEDRSLAYLETYRVALSLLRYCRERDGLPATLAELVPVYLSKVPEDPFDGQPIRYIKTASGFVAYSLGHDLDDDGGAQPPEGTNILKDGDIAFQVFDVSPYVTSSISGN